jgi:hypothetical protein
MGKIYLVVLSFITNQLVIGKISAITDNNREEGLHIAVPEFDSGSSPFVAAIPCLEMQAGLAFMVSVELL